MMKHIFFPAFCVTFLLSATMQAQDKPDNWIHVFSTENGKTRVVTALSDSIESISYVPDGDGYSKMQYNYIKDGQTKTESIDLTLVDSVEVSANVPLLIIKTNTPMNEIQSKENYVDMTIAVNGYGVYEDMASTAGTMKGRGNSTWVQFPKKPYRLKFSKKIEMCGLTKAKSYVLLANYIDPTLMRNAIAFKVGEMLGVPYTNHSIPVNLIFNGIDKGAYQLTEKIGFNNASLPIEDEEGILFCLDQDNIDEVYNARSSAYGVNYMVKDPDFAEVSETTGESISAMWNRWKKDFQAFESAVPNGDLNQYLDVESLVDYVLVYNLTGNKELNHPKSVYIYKENTNQTYKIGPLWDFDWAFSFGGNYQEGAGKPTETLFDTSSGARPGAKFFLGMIKNSSIKEEFTQLYKQKWEAFKECLPELWEYIDEYSHSVKVSAAENGVLWPTEDVNRNSGRGIGSTDIFPTHIENLKKWLKDRIEFIDNSANFGLY